MSESDKEWKDLYLEHRIRTHGQHLYVGEGGPEWSPDLVEGKTRACLGKMGISNFDKEHKCKRCLKSNDSD